MIGSGPLRKGCPKAAGHPGIWMTGTRVRKFLRPHYDWAVLRHAAFVLAALAGCASQDLALLRKQAATVATDAGWTRTLLDTGSFSLIAFTPPAQPPSSMLTVYIEGDGLAWIDSSTPSFDPTPIHPVALKLALADRHGQVAYLGRPCQYAQESERRNCRNRYWTSHRFAPEVIEATNLAINQLKARSGATHVRLVGYSGGGAVAALAAARRQDVTALVTVAGNLDHAYWTRANRITPLSGSLNPADAAAQLQHVPQRHYVGGRDRTVDASVARSYAARFGSPVPPVTVVPEFDHQCCWEKSWSGFAAQNFGLEAERTGRGPATAIAVPQ